MKTPYFIFLLFLTGCIGVDEVDDPLVGARISVEREQVSLLLSDSVRVSATYFDVYGIEKSVQLLWTSSNESVATIDISGLITGVGLGQANLKATFGNVESSAILVTVVESENDVANVTLTSPQGNQISVGQQVQLQVGVSTVSGLPLEGFPVSFTVLDPEILSVDDSGNVTGLQNGLGRVVAEVEGVQSNTLFLQVGTTSRTGEFSGANGYDASGSTELFIAENGDLMLRLNSDFETDFALGTYIYLSNSTSGSITRNEGLEIQEVTTGGSHLFNVSDISPSTSIGDYNFVIVLCKPASITFGIAELNP